MNGSVIYCLRSNPNQQVWSIAFLLTLVGIAQRVGDNVTALAQIVLRAVQVAVQPKLCRWQQVVECVAKASGSSRQPIAWISAQ
jgi:hypothetical protein